MIEFSSEAPYVTSGLLSQIFATASGYPYLTVNAFNPWALVLGDSGNSLANSGLWVWDGPWGPAAEGAGSAAFGPIPAVMVGSALMLAVVVAVSVVAAWRPDRLTILLSLTVLALAFYVVPTRVHERYAYPFFALAIILAAISWRWRPAYILASVTVFLNMYAALTNPFYDNPGVRDWLGIGPASRSFEGVAVIAVLNGLVFVWVLLQLRADARARLADELAIEQDLGLDEALALTPGAMAPRRRALADHDPALSPGSAAALSEPPATPFSAAGIFPDASPKPTLGRARSTAPASTVSAATAGGGPLGAATTGTAAALAVAPTPTRAAPLATKPSLPTWTPRASFEETGITGWFRSRFNERPIRPDRTATLRSEGGGRLDRMDLLLIVVLVVSTLLLRTFRLAEPYQMHFDEVYHARTATEFLQSWRYGISHDIYEWTHPHLAKYAMAGGLVAWGGDSVQSTSDLGVPIVAAAVEPRRIDELAPGQRAGERLHVATGTEIRTYDLTTRDLVSVVPAPGASAITVDETGNRLVIGYADGRLATLDLDLIGDGGVETGLTPDVLATVEQPIDRLFVTEDGGFVVVAGTERVTSVDLDAGTVAGTLDLPGVAALAGGGTGAALVAETDELTDPAAVASSLAEILSTDAAEYETQLTEAAPGTTVVLGDPGSGDARTALDAAISDGTLPGIRVDTVPRVAIATDDGVAFIDPTTASLITTIALDGGAHGLALVTGLDSPRLYVTTGLPGDPQYDVIAVGGDAAANGPVDQGLNPLPGGGASGGPLRPGHPDGPHPRAGPECR